jgi:hypothetical protein
VAGAPVYVDPVVADPDMDFRRKRALPLEDEIKVLVDPVYTGKPTTCSTSYLCWKIMEYMIDRRDDVFFHLMVPSHMLEDEEQRVWVMRRPDKVMVIPYKGTTTDRMKEHWTFPTEFADLLQPAHAKLWDVDAIITSRMNQLEMFRVNGSRWMSYGKGSLRAVIGLEEMPQFSFSETVSWAPGGDLDLLSLANYASADAVVINSLWGKREVLKVARQWLAPSKVRELDPSIYEALPIKLEPFTLREGDDLVRAINRPFNVAFCGRITGTRNFKAVAELFRKQFSFPMGKGEMKFVVSTNSASSGSSNYGDISVIDFEYNSREQFYEFLQTRADVAVNLSTVEDFSLSTYEPLSMGVPMIVSDRPWSEFLGPTYPFRVKSEVEAYAWINEFVKDYAGTYQRFAEWHESYWRPFVAGDRNNSTAEVVGGLLEQHREGMLAYLAEREMGQTYRDLIAQAEGDTLDIGKMLEAAEMMPPWGAPKGAVVAKTPVFQMVKQLALLAGWKDTLEPGIVVR